jgi:hypothetical protein
VNQTLFLSGSPRDWSLVPIAVPLRVISALAAQGSGKMVRFREQDSALLSLHRSLAAVRFALNVIPPSILLGVM